MCWWLLWILTICTVKNWKYFGLLFVISRSINGKMWHKFSVTGSDCILVHSAEKLIVLLICTYIHNRAMYYGSITSQIWHVVLFHTVRANDLINIIKRSTAERSRNVYTSLATLKTWFSLSRKERFHVAGNNKTYFGLHAKSPIFLSYFKVIFLFFQQIFLKSRILNFTDIRPIGAALMFADIRADGRDLNRHEIFAAVRTHLNTLKFVPCWLLFVSAIERTGAQRVRTASVGQALYTVFYSEHMQIRVALKITCSYPIR